MKIFDGKISRFSLHCQCADVSHPRLVVVDSGEGAALQEGLGDLRREKNRVNFWTLRDGGFCGAGGKMGRKFHFTDLCRQVSG